MLFFFFDGCETQFLAIRGELRSRHPTARNQVARNIPLSMEIAGSTLVTKLEVIAVTVLP